MQKEYIKKYNAIATNFIFASTALLEKLSNSDSMVQQHFILPELRNTLKTKRHSFRLPARKANGRQTGVGPDGRHAGPARTFAMLRGNAALRG
jgi:hypothetical protein